MEFTKMQGIGNDYVYINCMDRYVPNAPELAKRISDRHFGVGSDGLILICPSETADFQMVMYNADGSRAQMCGNGIRCVGKYVYDNCLTDKTTITVETLGGIKTLLLHPEDGKVKSVTVDMGIPVFDPKHIPVLSDGKDFIDRTVTVDGKKYRITALSMGNPHAVVFVDDTDSLDLRAIGPAFENHPLFPERINTEFVEVVDHSTLKMRVWERGSEETMACGTGACAAAVVGCVRQKSASEVTVKLLGGDLLINWDEETKHVFMTGPAETVFVGEIDIE